MRKRRGGRNIFYRLDQAVEQLIGEEEGGAILPLSGTQGDPGGVAYDGKGAGVLGLLVTVVNHLKLEAGGEKNMLRGDFCRVEAAKDFLKGGPHEKLEILAHNGKSVVVVSPAGAEAGG